MAAKDPKQRGLRGSLAAHSLGAFSLGRPIWDLAPHLPVLHTDGGPTVWGLTVSGYQDLDLITHLLGLYIDWGLQFELPDLGLITLTCASHRLGAYSLGAYSPGAYSLGLPDWDLITHLHAFYKKY